MQHGFKTTNTIYTNYTIKHYIRPPFWFWWWWSLLLQETGVATIADWLTHISIPCYIHSLLLHHSKPMYWWLVAAPVPNPAVACGNASGLLQNIWFEIWIIPFLSSPLAQSLLYTRCLSRCVLSLAGFLWHFVREEYCGGAAANSYSCFQLLKNTWHSILLAVALLLYLLCSAVGQSSWCGPGHNSGRKTIAPN
jgi:hypothetical protein